VATWLKPDMTSPHNPIIVALDVPSPEAAIRLARQVAPHVGAVKVGKELFVSGGPDIVRELRSLGCPVFLDLKFHDIPHTVAKAVAAATRLDVQMLTVHASGGSEMLRAAREAADDTARASHRPPPLLLAVTVLTSMDVHGLGELGLTCTTEQQVIRLARMAARSGIPGIVCSPLELHVLRPLLPEAMKYVTPGIRQAGSSTTDDQKRTLGPAEALAAGAHWLVVGRPIHGAPDPAAAVRELERVCCR
jgi:orotidine-5'-phosphate decarboxylase